MAGCGRAENLGNYSRRQRSSTRVPPDRSDRPPAGKLAAPPTGTIKSSGMANPGSTADETEIPTIPPGTTLGKYNVIRLLGAGGMGAVYEATHIEIGKKVAIKVLSPLIAAVPGARARFLREAQLTSRVRHPHIVDVADMGSDAGSTYLVMEFLHGEDLAQRLERLGPVGVEELADIMLPVCSAVAAAHAAGV